MNFINLLTIKQSLITGQNILKKAMIISPFLDAEILLGFVLKKTKEFLYTYPEKEVSKKDYQKYIKLIKKREKNIPIAYLINSKEFYGSNFYVNENVLIPRPDTEILVDETLKDVKDLLGKYKKIAIADLGCGSGAIAVCVAKNLNPEKTKIFASDISEKALAVAKKNARTHKVKIKFLKGDLFKPFENKKIDLIVANLPYLKTLNKITLLKKPESKSLKYEPQKALFSGKDGLDLYKKLFKQISQTKFKPKYMLLECDSSQTKILKKIIEKFFFGCEIEIVQNLCGNNIGLKVKL